MVSEAEDQTGLARSGKQAARPTLFIWEVLHLRQVVFHQRRQPEQAHLSFARHQGSLPLDDTALQPDPWRELP
jgi:hypothetical protein